MGFSSVVHLLISLCTIYTFKLEDVCVAELMGGIPYTIWFSSIVYLLTSLRTINTLELTINMLELETGCG